MQVKCASRPCCESAFLQDFRRRKHAKLRSRLMLILLRSPADRGARDHTTDRWELAAGRTVALCTRPCTGVCLTDPIPLGEPLQHPRTALRDRKHRAEGLRYRGVRYCRRSGATEMTSCPRSRVKALARSLSRTHYSFRNSTFCTRWSDSLRSTSVARARVGRMFSTRLGSLMLFQNSSASATAASSSREANRRK